MTILADVDYRFRVRGGAWAAIAALNEIPLRREFVFELDTGKFKVGDGVTHYNDLPYSNPIWFAEATGADTINATFVPSLVLFDGLTVGLRAAAANTGAVTLDADGSGAIEVTKFGGVPLEADDIFGPGHELLLRYVEESSPRWELLNPAASGAGGGGAAIEVTRTMTAHGFVVGTPVTMDGSDWVAADRGDETKSAELIVSEVVDANTFKGVVRGLLTLTTGEWDAVTGGSGGLTVDNYYWLDAVAGTMTLVMPTTGVRQCLVYAISTTEALVILGEPLSTDDPADTGYNVSTVTAASSAQTAMEGTRIILCDTTSNNITINLPTAVGNIATYIIKKINAANTVTIDPSGSETVDGSSTATISVHNESRSLISDGTNWRVV